jgi:16S rRNA (cytosine967-C5)-methyltransferase
MGVRVKVHRLLAEAAAALVASVIRDRRVLDRELAALFARNPRWGKRDRSFVAETAFEVVRWSRALTFVADSDETSAQCAAQWLRMGCEIPAWWTHSGCAAEEMLSREAMLPSQPRAVRESIPDWLDETGLAELGDHWDRELTALNRRARIYLRANTLRNTAADAISWLTEQGIDAEAVPGFSDAIVLKEGVLLPTQLKNDGRVEIQDVASQCIAPLVGARPGDVMVDACAGAGGKTLHLAACMQNQGIIHALDADARRLQTLAQRAMRAGVSIIRTHATDDSILRQLKGSADCVLIDAPCSGLGTLKRQPDLKWRLTPERLNDLRALQLRILRDHAALVKPGGRLVYATCSILPSENRSIVDEFLNGAEFDFVESLQISPADFGFDGFGAAVLSKRFSA